MVFQIVTFWEVNLVLEDKLISVEPLSALLMSISVGQEV